MTISVAENTPYPIDTFYMTARLRQALIQLEADRTDLHLQEDILLSSPAQSMAGNVFRTLLGFCVYIIWREQDALYVGYSGRALNRISEPLHAAQEAIQACDQVHFYPCHTEQLARFLEAKLIRKLRPKYNKNGSARIRTFRSFQPKLNNLKETKTEQNVPS